MRAGSISNSGINAAITQQDITAHNISNINTKAYKSKEAIQSEQKNSGTKISAIRENQNKDKTLSGTKPEKELPKLKENLYALKANGRVLKVQNSMLGEIIDLKK